MAIELPLEQHHLSVGVTLPPRRNTHLKVPNNIETTRLQRINREQSRINCRPIICASSVAVNTKQVGKHLLGGRCTVSELTIITVLNNHNPQGNRRRDIRHLLQVEAKVQVLDLDRLADYVIHLRPLLHRGIKHRIAIRKVVHTNISKLSEATAIQKDRIVVLLNLRSEAAINRSYLAPKRAPIALTTIASAAKRLATCSATCHKKEKIVWDHQTIAYSVSLIVSDSL